MALDRLSAEDRLTLWPDARWPQDIGALALFDGSALQAADGQLREDVVRDAIAGRLYLLPRLRQIVYRPRRGLGGPLWLDDPTFDLGEHVRCAQVAAPGDERRLLEAVGRIRRRRLDPARPLWEMWFLTGLADGRIGLFARLHHVVADGIAGVASLGAFLDQTAEWEPVQPQPWVPAPPPQTRDLLLDVLHRRAAAAGRALSVLRRPLAGLGSAAAAWPALRELFTGKPGPQTSLNRVIGRERELALVRADLDAVKRTAHTHGAKVDDVLLATIAGGLGALLRDRGEPVDGITLPVYVPVSLRSSRPGREVGNLISQMVVRLPVGPESPGVRLRAIAAETAVRKALRRPSLGAVFRSKLVSALMLRLIIRQRINVATADLPGPAQPLYFAGAQLLELFPMDNLVGNVSLGVAALSYAGQLNIMAIADAEGYPDLDVLAAGMRAELDALAPSPIAG
jgi:diacylglycerol O-acyltransferase